MYHISSLRCSRHRRGFTWSNGPILTLSKCFQSSTYKTPCLVTSSSYHIHHIKVPELSYAKQSSHVLQVAEQLRKTGILKATLQFPDIESQYLDQLISSLHQGHGHRLPIRHSALRGSFWDIRPSTTSFQAMNYQARSETMNEFPWHTDCSYEYRPSRYFALHVLQHDRYGGGTLSLMNVKSLAEHLSPTTVTSLARPEYQFKVPPEFVKRPDQQSILGSIMVANDECGELLIRFREDILSAKTRIASCALEELKEALQDHSVQSSSVLHLSAEQLPKGSVILIDNRRWLHARNRIYDPERHLRRVRWDAVPFA
jgi:hypothetical protein